MNTSAWGPPGWEFLFFVAAGYDVNETPKETKDEQYKAFFQSVGDVLPCRYCRESYVKFFDYLDIDKYMEVPSCGLMKYVYDMKNLVNAKLIKQEDLKLRKEVQKLVASHDPEDPLLEVKIEKAARDTLYTKPAPPFEDVASSILQHRAGCSAQLKACREPIVQAPSRVPVWDFDPFDNSRYRDDGHLS